MEAMARAGHNVRIVASAHNFRLLPATSGYFRLLPLFRSTDISPSSDFRIFLLSVFHVVVAVVAVVGKEITITYNTIVTNYNNSMHITRNKSFLRVEFNQTRLEIVFHTKFQ